MNRGLFSAHTRFICNGDKSLPTFWAMALKPVQKRFVGKSFFTMNGLEKAKERWRVLCEMFMDEDW